jgi:hypothetical protein
MENDLYYNLAFFKVAILRAHSVNYEADLKILKILKSIKSKDDYLDLVTESSEKLQRLQALLKVPDLVKFS